MVELPKTEAELQAYVDEQIQAKQTEWESKQNEMFATQRKKHQAEIDKIKADAGKSAEEIAQTIYFLASENADYITGQVIGVNGGYVI